jgi:hypothetical protein
MFQLNNWVHLKGCLLSNTKDRDKGRRRLHHKEESGILLERGLEA